MGKANHLNRINIIGSGCRAAWGISQVTLSEAGQQDRSTPPTLYVIIQTSQPHKFVSQVLDDFSQTPRQPLSEYVTVTSQSKQQQMLHVTSQTYQQLQPSPPRLFVMKHLSCQRQATQPNLHESAEVTSASASSAN